MTPPLPPHRREPLIVWGASGHAKVVADIVRVTGRYAIRGFLDDRDEQSPGRSFCGATVLGGRQQLEALRNGGVSALIVGVGDCHARLRLAALAVAAGYRLPTAIHPAAVVASDAEVGLGTVIVAGAVVNPSSRLGEHAIVNTGATVDHDCILDDGVHISPGAHLGGGVRVGRASSIGIGANVRDHVIIGANAIVGAGSLVLTDVPDDVVVFGCPARVVRRNETRQDAPGIDGI
jgi:acetyltransferase EpsM